MSFKKVFNKNFFSSGSYIVILAFFIGIFGLVFAQHPYRPASLGDDAIYGKITQGFPEAVFGHKLDDYRLKRILPLGLVHYSLRIFSFPLTFQNIANAFSFWSIILLVLIALFWNKIVNELAISQTGRFLGFLAIFCNYHFLKHVPLIQITTDVFAYTITMALLYFYLKDNLTGMCISTFIGAFSWPTIFHMGFLMILLKRDAKNNNYDNKKAPLKLNYVLPLGFIIFILFNLDWILKAFKVGRVFSMGIFSMGSNRPIMSVIYLSILIMLFYVFFALSTLLNGKNIFSLKYWISKFDLARLIILLLMVSSIKAIIHFGAASHNARPIDYLVKNLLMVSIMQPGTFIISHIMFFGPILIFALFLWKQVCSVVRSYGIGLVFCFIIIILFSLDSESRKQMNTYSIFIPFLIKTIDSYQWNKFHLWIISILSLLFSRVWLWFPNGWLEGSILEFPKQYYGMSVGPWMSHKMYALQAAIVFITALAVYFLMFRKMKLKTVLSG